MTKRLAVDPLLVTIGNLAVAHLPIGSSKSESECRFPIEGFDRRAKLGDNGDFESLDQAVFDYFKNRRLGSRVHCRRGGL